LSKELATASKEQQNKRAAEYTESTVRPIQRFVVKESLKGLTAGEIVNGLKIEFSTQDLTKTAKYWKPLLARPMPKQAASLLTSEMVKEVAEHKVQTGKLSRTAAEKLPESPKEALKHILRNATAVSVSTPNKAAAENLVIPFTGERAEYNASPWLIERIAKHASQLMVRGLFGYEVMDVLSNTYMARDIKAASGEIRKAAQEYSKSLPKKERAKLASKLVRPAVVKTASVEEPNMVETLGLQNPLEAPIDFEGDRDAVNISLVRGKF